MNGVITRTTNGTVGTRLARMTPFIVPAAVQPTSGRIFCCGGTLPPGAAEPGSSDPVLDAG
jgi:hypothetical protein